MRRMFSDWANYIQRYEDEKKKKKPDDKFCINTFEKQKYILKNRYDMPFGIQIIKNTKRFSFNFFFMKLHVFSTICFVQK